MFFPLYALMQKLGYFADIAAWSYKWLTTEKITQTEAGLLIRMADVL